LLDTDHQPAAVNVRDLQADDLGYARERVTDARVVELVGVLERRMRDDAMASGRVRRSGAGRKLTQADIGKAARPAGGLSSRKGSSAANRARTASVSSMAAAARRRSKI